ncbi:MAG: hypothetical protein H8E38_01920 [SAR324 cluster bacterium]|nr:hypothetical protein [SAR324 cluster bacterium]MBL7034242.1 hypothetical protein [SAR324 cluster bacterium]
MKKSVSLKIATGAALVSFVAFACAKSDDTASTASSNNTTTASGRPTVVECSSLTTELGQTAVTKLAEYGYKKCSMVFGILIANSNEVTIREQDITAMTQSIADILAEALDNDQNGTADDSTVVAQLKTSSTGTWINVQSQANQTNEDTIVSAMSSYLGKDMGIKYSWLAGDYTASMYGTIYEKHMIVEEVTHLMHHYGYAKAYPTKWGVSDDGCGSNTSSGCDWNQSTLTKLAFEAMTSSSNWYYHGENTTNDNGSHITGSCAGPSCAAVEFIMNVVMEYRNIRHHDSDNASSGTAFPTTSSGIATILESTANGIAMKAILDDATQNQFIKGMTWSYNPTSSQ